MLGEQTGTCISRGSSPKMISTWACARCQDRYKGSALAGKKAVEERAGDCSFLLMKATSPSASLFEEQASATLENITSPNPIPLKRRNGQRGNMGSGQPMGTAPQRPTRQVWNWGGGGQEGSYQQAATPETYTNVPF